MKKSFFAGISILTLLSVTLFSSCKGKTAAAASVSDPVPEYKERKIIKLDASNSETLSYSSMKDFFDLDFTPEYPDEVFSEKGKNAAAVSGIDKDIFDEFLEVILLVKRFITISHLNLGNCGILTPHRNPQIIS